MKILYLILSIILLSTNIFAEEIDVSKLPKLLGSGNMGREFYFTFIPSWELHAIKWEQKIYVISNVKTKVTLERRDQNLSITKYTKINDIIEFNLTPPQAMPYRKAGYHIPEPDQVWIGAGIHIIADDPVICYAVTPNPSSYTAEAFLILPVNTLGNEYIVSSYADPTYNIKQFFPSYAGITAVYDKTKVKFIMGGNDSSLTVGGIIPGDTTIWNMNAGDVLLFASLGKGADLSGSKVIATKPVSVVSGNFCAYVPIECGLGNLLEEMEIPIKYWGNTYHVTPIVGRSKNSIIKIFAKEPETKIYRDGVQIGYIPFAGGVEGVGHLHIRADAGTPRPIVYSSDKPINITQYNTGMYDDTLTNNNKPFQMVLIPTEQYQKEITFNTPGIRGGFGFPNNYINLCFESDSTGTISEDLELGIFNYKDSVFYWYKLKDTFAITASPFKKINGKKQYSSTTFKLPGDGVYKLKANMPFQAYLYGGSSYDSYGFPASVSLKDLTKNDTLPPKPVWKMNGLGHVNDPDDPVTGIEEVKDLPEDANFSSNLSSIYMHTDSSFNYELYVTEFFPCEDQTAVWQLRCLNNGEDARAVITFTDCAGNDTTLYIDYIAPRIKFSDSVLDFGNVELGKKIDKVFYFINYNDTTPFVEKDIHLQKKNTGFSLWNLDGITPLTFPIDVLPLDTLKFIVRFEATQYGEFWDSLGFAGYCGGDFWYKAIVKANVGNPIIQVSEINFTKTDVGDYVKGSFSIKNRGMIYLKIFNYEGPYSIGGISASKIYTFPQGGLSNENFPIWITQNDVRTFEVIFSPDDTLNFSDSIVFISNSRKTYTLGITPDSVCILFGQGIKSTSVHENKSDGIKIYPNPASDKLYISGIKSNSTLRIFDLLGNLKYSEIHAEKFESIKIIDILSFDYGIYLINVSSGSNTFIEKIIIQK